MQIKPLLVAALETAVNNFIALDDGHEALLAPLAGKVVAINITPFDETLYLCPTADRIQFLESYTGQPDATLSGSLTALGLMGLSATPMRSLFKGEVRIDGDTQVARRLQRLFEKLNIDWQGRLARYTGDDIARRIGNLVMGGRDWTRRAMQNFRLNLEEFLQEETRELPAKAEAEIVFQQIDQLRLDQDRLDARVNRLNHPLANPFESPTNDKES